MHIGKSKYWIIMKKIKKVYVANLNDDIRILFLLKIYFWINGLKGKFSSGTEF